MNNMADCITLKCAPRKNLLLIGALLLWLLLWGGVLVIVGNALLRGEVKEAGFFVVFFLVSWLVTWFIGGGLALHGVLWMWFGVETIVVNPAELTVTREVGGFRRVRCYAAGRVRNLRIAERGKVIDFFLSLRPFGIGDGQLTFDYGANVITFADGIERASAPELLDEVRRILSVRQESTHV